MFLSKHRPVLSLLEPPLLVRSAHKLALGGDLLVLRRHWKFNIHSEEVGATIYAAADIASAEVVPLWDDIHSSQGGETICEPVLAAFRST